MALTRRELVSNGLVVGLGVAVASSVVHAHDEEEPHPHPEPEPEAPPALLRVQVALFDGFAVTDALAPFDVLKIAGKLGAPIEVSLVSVNGAQEVIALDDVRVKPTAAFDASADVLLVPGAPTLWQSVTPPVGLVEAFAAFLRPGKLIGTISTGAVFAARAGLLQARNANTAKAAHELIVELGAVLQPARVVDDGDFLSSAGGTAGLDLALYLIERHFGAALAVTVEGLLEYERRGIVWRA